MAEQQDRLEPIEETKHYFLGGSNAVVWRNCFGAPHLMALMPKMVATKIMKAGTGRHEELHRAYSGEEDAETREVQDALKDIEGLRMQLTLNGAKIVHEGTEITLQHSTIKELGGTPDWFGVNDAGCIAVLDLKNRSDLGVKEQIETYLTLVADSCKEIGVAATYAIAACSSAMGYEEWAYGAEEFREMADSVELSTGFTLSEPNNRTVGSWCERCRAKGICPEFQLSINPEIELAAMTEKTAITKLSDEQLHQLLTNRKKIRDALDSAESYAKERVRQQNPIQHGGGGWFLKAGNKVRQWVADAAEKLIALGMTEVVETKVKGVGELEKRYGKALPQELFTYRQNNPSLVWEEDISRAVSLEEQS